MKRNLGEGIAKRDDLQRRTCGQGATAKCKVGDMASDNERIAQLTRQKRRPSTPGDLLADLMECNNIAQGELAERLGISRATVNRIIQRHRSMTPDLSHRLGRLFGNGPAIWIKFQQQVDLWDALHLDDKECHHIKPLHSNIIRAY